MSNRKSRAISGILAGTSGSVILQLATLAVTPLYLNLTSQELFGLWLTLAAVLGWVKIGDMGLGMALTRRSVEALENKDYELLCRLAYGAIFPAFVFSTLITGTGYLVTDNLISIFDIGSTLESDFKKTYHILLIVALIRSALGSFGSLIDGKQHIAFLHIRNTTVSLLTTALTLVFLFLDFGIISFGYALLFEAIIMPFIDITYLRIIDKNIIFFPIKTSKKEIVSLLKFGGPFQVLKLTNLANTNVDNIIIASIIGASSVSIFVFSGKLAFLFAIFLISIIPSMLFPGITQLFELGDTKKIISVYLKLSNIAIRLGLLMGTIYFIINESFINLWVGPENYGGFNLTAIFVFWIILESFIRGITVIIYSSGKLHGLTVVSSIEAGLNILLTLLLINSLGIFGVALATVLSRLISTFYVPYLVNKSLKINSIEYVKGLMSDAIFYSMPMIFFVSILFLFTDVVTSSIIQASAIATIALALNIISFEGIFLLKYKGMRWSDRFKLLKNYYFSV